MSEIVNHFNDSDSENDNKFTITYKCEKCEKTYKNKYRYKNHSCKKDEHAIIKSLINTIQLRISDKSSIINLIQELMRTKGIYNSDINVHEDNGHINKDQKTNKNTINNNTTNNNTINNNTVNNIIHIHLYNMSDAMKDTKILDTIINEQFINKYYIDMKKNGLKLKENMIKRNNIDYDDSLEIKINDRANDTTINEIHDTIIKRCTYLFEHMYFSVSEPNYQIIYVNTSKPYETFYIHEDNVWRKQGDLKLLCSIAQKLYETFTKKCDEKGYDMINKITHDLYYNKNGFTKIAIKLRTYAYENRHIVKDKFDSTFKTKPEIKTLEDENLFEEGTIDEDDKIKFANEISTLFKKKKSIIPTYTPKTEQQHRDFDRCGYHNIVEDDNMNDQISDKIINENKNTSEYKSKPNTRIAHNGEEVEYNNSVDVTQEEINGIDYIICDSFIYEYPEDLEDMGIEDLIKVGKKLTEDTYEWY
jgi:hypothetical protein